MRPSSLKMVSNFLNAKNAIGHIQDQRLIFMSLHRRQNCPVIDGAQYSFRSLILILNAFKVNNTFLDGASRIEADFRRPRTNTHIYQSLVFLSSCHWCCCSSHSSWCCCFCHSCSSCCCCCYLCHCCCCHRCCFCCWPKIRQNPFFDPSVNFFTTKTSGRKNGYGAGLVFANLSFRGVWFFFDVLSVLVTMEIED